VFAYVGSQACTPGRSSDQELPTQRLYAKSSVDDLGTCRGVVLSRAATILRSIETLPSTRRFVLNTRTPSILRGSGDVTMTKTRDSSIGVPKRHVKKLGT
jgi:hypothetical protein